MYCSHCGTKNQEDDRFCVKCGKPLTESGAVENKAVIHSVDKPGQKKRSWSFIGLLILILLVAASVFAIYKIWQPLFETIRGDTKSTPSTLPESFVWSQFEEMALLDSVGYSQVISPDGNSLAYQLGNYQIALWDTSSKQVSRVLEGHTDVIISMHFSPDGRSLASSAYDWSVILWDLQDGSIIHKWDIGDLCGVHFLDGGETLVTDCFETRSLYYWDTKSGEKKLDYFGWLTKSANIEFSPLDNALLQYGFATTYVNIYDRDYVNELGTASFDLSAEVVSAAFLPDGMNYVAAFFDGKVGIWNINSDDPIWQKEYSDGNRVEQIVVSKNDLNPYIVFVNYDGTVDLMDISTKSIQTINNASYALASISYDNQILALATDDNQIEIWTIADATLQQTISDLGDKIWRILFSPMGNLMAIVVPAKNQTLIYRQK